MFYRNVDAEIFFRFKNNLPEYFGLFPNKNKAIQAIKNGAVRINKEKIVDISIPLLDYKPVKNYFGDDCWVLETGKGMNWKCLFIIKTESEFKIFRLGE